MYEHTIRILSTVTDHYKKMRSEEIEGYNKRGDKMGALGCAMAYEQIFADISDAINTLKSISEEMSKANDEELQINTLKSISEEMDKDEKEADDAWEESSAIYEIKKSDKEENHEGKLQSD